MVLTITYDDTVSVVKTSQQMLNCIMRGRAIEKEADRESVTMGNLNHVNS